MKKLTSEEAITLLKKDVINCDEDILKPENRWFWHCLYVGEAAGRIATKLGLDADKAMALGYVHDIGRKINHAHHAIEGFRYMKEKGYEEESLICLTHSFVNNDLNLVAGGELSISSKLYLGEFVSESNCTIYDIIVQMCDLFCLETGFTTVENRLLDIYTRKGIFSNTKDHFDSVMELKSNLENVMNCSLYSLFPEISQNELENIDNDHVKLVKLLENSQKKSGK